jgi:hypothetical protein
MEQINFAALEARAREMSVASLHYALQDILRTLPGADAMDRAYGGPSRGGKYRDEASVYRRELARRAAL